MLCLIHKCCTDGAIPTLPTNELPIYFMITSKIGNNPREEGDVFVDYHIYKKLTPLKDHFVYIKKKLENYKNLTKKDQILVVELYEDIRPHLRYTYGYDLPSMRREGMGGGSNPEAVVELIPVILGVLAVICCILTLGGVSECCNTSGS